MRSFTTTTESGGRTTLVDAHPRATASIAIVVGPVGRLEGPQSAPFRRRLAALSLVEGADVTVDLAAVPAMDTVTARCLADAGAVLRQNAGRLSVHRSRHQPRAMLRQAGLAAELVSTASHAGYDYGYHGDQS